MQRIPVAVRGVVYIYISLIIALVFGLVSSSITSKIMPVKDLGQYRFIVSCVSVVVSASTLGLFSSAGTLLAGSKSSLLKASTCRGASTQAWLVSGLTSASVAVILFSSHRTDFTARWLLVIMLAGSMGWPLLMQEVLRAKGSYLGLGLLNAGPSALFILLLGASRILGIPADFALCTGFYFVSQGVVVCIIILLIKFPIVPGRLDYLFIFRRNTNLGLNVYWGTFLAALTAQSGIFILELFRSPEDVAMFSLAITVTAPLALLPSAVGTAYFSQLPGAQGFPTRVLRYAWVTAAFIAFVFCLLVPFAISFLYGHRFAAVTVPAQICGVGAILQGMGDVYNRYYLANRDTAFLLRNALFVCIISIVFGIAAGSAAGMIGVSTAKIISSGVYVFSLVYYYHFAGRRFGQTRL